MLIAIWPLLQAKPPTTSFGPILEIMPISERVKRLRALPTIREQCSKVYEIAEQNGEGDFFELHTDKLGDVAEYCLRIIKVS